MSDSATQVRELDPQEVAELRDRGEIDVVDVRSPEERRRGALPGSIHRTADELAADPGDLGVSRPVVFYCRSGERSTTVAEAFAASGRQAMTLRGGLVAWAEAGFELDPPDGEVAPYILMPPR
ncbi:MAG: rhodanese-like domain-containing protein [Thermoleophilum sp.]|nr:rhodanese-like domain-containing protein [Thermoleophilum sp.]